MIFAGATRYRVPWDFLLALLAAGALTDLLRPAKAAGVAVRVVHVHRIAGIGGSERHLLTLLPALRRAGVEAAFVGLDAGGDPDAVLRRARPGAAVPTAATSVRAAPAGALLASARTSSTPISSTPTSSARSRPARKPLVSTKHNDDPFRTGPFRFVERLLTRRARAVICITEALARFQVERVGLPARRSTVVHYGLDEPPPAWSADPPLELPDGRARAARPRPARAAEGL